jgi:FixJ family two-component response regulator
VDDDEAVRDAIGSLVRSAGFRAALFSSAEAFLDSDRRGDAECLILDLRMPRTSGFDLQARLAQMGCRTPIVFATACTDSDMRKRALDRGAIAYLHKPFSDDALFDAVRQALNN